MADMYGAVRSNSFKVKDVEKFKAWFAAYYFGYDIELWVDDEQERILSFGGYEQYPSAHLRRFDGDDVIDADLQAFAEELCRHLEEGEVFSVTAGGHEKLRYVSFDQLIIAQQHPKDPLYEHYSSDDGNDVLLKRLAQDDHKDVLKALTKLLDAAADLDAAIHGATDQFDDERRNLATAMDAATAVIALVEGA